MSAYTSRCISFISSTLRIGFGRKGQGRFGISAHHEGGVGVGGQFGEGALRIDGKNVAYYSISSASVGLTLGLAKHKEVILFMTQEALDKFTTSHGWSIGADTGVAVLSKGAGGDYDTQSLQRPILAFVFGEKGLIGDVSLDGSKVNKLDR